MEKCRRVVDKSAVLLIDGNLVSYRSDHPPLKAAIIPVFLHFDVINESLAANPAQ